MLTIYYGADSLRQRTALLKEVATHGDASVVRFDETSISLMALEDTLGVVGLFAQKTVVILDSVLEKSDVYEGVLALLPNLQISENLYFLLAGEMTAPEKKLFVKSGARLVESSSFKKPNSFNTSSFALAEAVGRKDKKTAWVLYRKAIDSGSSPQEICGTLIWQMRLVVLAYTASNFSDAGVTEFPFKKAQGFKRNYSLQEAKKLLARFLGIYHFDPSVNRGKTETALEKALLTL